MKKSLFTLFTSLIVCGLLLVWSVDAFKYTASWDSRIAFENLRYVEKIEFWSKTINVNSTICKQDSINNLWYICELTWVSNNYEVNVSFIWNNNYISYIRLDLPDNNITSIQNYDWITIGSLYLSNNEDLNLNGKSPNKITDLHVESCNQDTFNIGISNYSNDNNFIHFENNRLTDISHELFCSNYSLVFYTKTYGNSPKKIYFDGNPINLIKITKVWSDDTCNNTTHNTNWSNNLHFERFGYSYNTNISYEYQILQGNSPVEWTFHTDSSTWTDINKELEPWYYTFEVCYDEDNESNTKHCDTTDFIMSYYLWINLTNWTTIDEDEEISSLDNIKFEWEDIWNYPENFINQNNKYYFELKENNTEVIYSWETNSKSIIIDEDTKWKMDNWANYTFDVYVLDREWNKIRANQSTIINCTNWYEDRYGSYSCYDWYNESGDIHASRSFTVAIQEGEDPKIQITRPLNPETGAVTYFSWAPTIDTGYFDFNNYYWLISWVDNSTLLTGLIMDISNTWFSTGNLNNGNYTFNVMLNYTKKSNWETGVATDDRYSDNGGAIRFTVAKTYPSIKINRPLDNETGAITYFSWTPNVTSWFSFNNYEWVISGNNAIYTGMIDNKNTTWFTRNDLNNWTYTFNVKLNYTQNSNWQTGYAIDSGYSENEGTKTFIINKPSSLSIISPADWATLTQAESIFSRTWDTSNTFVKYSYTITWNNYLYTWETTDKNDTSFSIQNLEDWAYTFTIIMETNAGNETDSTHFNVSATSWAYINITSPENSKIYTWNRIKLVPINFTWVWTWSSRINKFTYKLTNTNTNNEITWWTINKNSNWNYSIPGTSLSLPSGKYKFEVKMLDSNGTTIKEKTHNFTVNIPSYLTINTPPAWQLSSKNVTFSRTWFAEFGDHYKYKLDRINDQWSIISPITWSENTSITSFSMTNIHNGKYTFTVSIMNSGNIEIISGSRTFWIPDDQDLILDISDWVTSTRALKAGTWIFSWWWKSEDFNWYYYSISGTNFKNESVIYTWKTAWEVTWSITLTNLSSWRYRFLVNMLDENDAIITWKYLDFTVAIPASLKITNPSNWSTVTSSSTTFSWIGNWDIFWTWYSTDSRHYQYELLKVLSWWYEQKASSPATNANSFSYTSLENWASYKLEVKLYSGNTLLARDASTFTVSISKPSWGGGGWGGSSSKSHHTNDLSVSVTNDEPTTNERVEVVVDISDKYTWKVDFTKMQYYSFDEEKRIDIPVTSKNYVSDYSDDAKLGYVKFDSSDKWEKSLSEFLMFSQPGNYRIHVEDKDWYKEYTEFYVWKWNNKAQVTTTKIDEDEYYIARSCKKYKLEYLNNLGVRTSPNLKKDEYFINKDYFKRYIDSKNKQIDWCPTNIWWISTTYSDKSNSSSQYAAPNGKVYFISNQNGKYSSNELDKELNGSKKFSTISDLKYFIRDRNPFINMYAPVK